MLNDNAPLTLPELEQANRELRQSLKKCQQIVAECRDKLALQGEASFPDSREASAPKVWNRPPAP